MAYNNDTYVSVDDDDNADNKANGNVAAAATAIMASQSCSSADSRLVIAELRT